MSVPVAQTLPSVGARVPDPSVTPNLGVLVVRLLARWPSTLVVAGHRLRIPQRFPFQRRAEIGQASPPRWSRN
jgi:hypothetical protein